MTQEQMFNSQKTKTSQEKKRGVFLTIWLILLLLGNINALFGILINVRVVSQLDPELFSGVLVWMIYVMGFFLFFNVISLIFLFRWKKWAFFTLLISYFFIFVITIFILPVLGFMLGGGMFLLLGILYFLLRPKWRFLQ
jgi:hypothetical protein